MSRTVRKRCRDNRPDAYLKTVAVYSGARIFHRFKTAPIRTAIRRQRRKQPNNWHRWNTAKLRYSAPLLARWFTGVPPCSE